MATTPRLSPEPSYGSDHAGLVCGYAFRPGQPGVAVTTDEAMGLLESGGGNDTFLWLHFNLSNAASTQWLQQNLRLPDAFFHVQKDHSSTRIEVVEQEALVGVLNDVQFFATEASTVSSVALHVSRRLLVTARTTHLRAVDRLRITVKAGEVFRSPAELLAHLLRDQADVLVDLVRDAARQVDLIEDRILSHQPTSRPRLSALRRGLVKLQRLLAPEPAALFRLLNKPPPWIVDPDLGDLRHAAEELSAAVADSTTVVERIRLLQEELMAIVNEQTNRTLFILTVVTVLALPMTIVPGLFGMNVGGVPFAEQPSGFWIVVALVCTGVGGAAALAWSRYLKR